MIPYPGSFPSPGLSVFLAAWMGAAPAPAVEVSCEGQGLEMGKFFETPSIEFGEVTTYLKTDADSASRDESGGPPCTGR